MSQMYESRAAKERYDAYARLQSAAIGFGENLPIPEIVAIGGQSDGKSSLLEAFLGFRFNIREVEMGTRRPLMLQMVHDPTALEPRVCIQDEDSDAYGKPITPESNISEVIKTRTEELLKNLGGAAVSSKPIVMKAEFAFCPNLTIIDTPGFIMKARVGEPEGTPDEILNMVKELAAPPHRIILFLQQSSVEWCSSLWLHVVQQVDPSMSRTLLVASKFDNRLKEFTSRYEVDRYLSASGFLPPSVRPFFVALPKERGGSGSSADFRALVESTDTTVLDTMRNQIEGGFDEPAFGDRVGFKQLRQHLEEELGRRYREAAPGLLAVVERRAATAGTQLAEVEARLAGASNVGAQRRLGMQWASQVLENAAALLEGSSEPDPTTYGQTTEEERRNSGVGPWQGVAGGVKPPHSDLRLHGGAAFERTLAELQSAALSVEFPSASREKVANVLLGRGGGHHQSSSFMRGPGGHHGMMMMPGAGGPNQGVAEDIARQAVQSALGPLLDVACERLAYVLRRLVELALVRLRLQAQDPATHHHQPAASSLSSFNPMMTMMTTSGGGGGGCGGAPPAAFQTALRRTFDRFIGQLTMQTKEMMRHHLANSTSPFAISAAFQMMDLRSHQALQHAPMMMGDVLTDGENETKVSSKHSKYPSDAENDASRDPLVAVDDNARVTRNRGGAAGKSASGGERGGGSHATPPPPMFASSVVEETPSPQQGSEEGQMRRAQFSSAARGGGVGSPPSESPAAKARPSKQPRLRQGQQQVVGVAGGGSVGGGGGGARSPYHEVTHGAEALFDRIRRYLAQDVVPTALRGGFLTPCHTQLSSAVMLELFACSDQDFAAKFSVAGELEHLKNQRDQLAALSEKLTKSQYDFEAIVHQL